MLRGINVGGNNKVVMSELREQVAAEGFANVRTYVNSGNLLFEAEADVPRDEVAEAVEHVLARRYDFPIRLALLTGQDYLAELHNLPDWWHGEVARRDALFYTRGLDRGHVRERIEAMELGDEAVYFGEHAVFGQIRREEVPEDRLPQASPTRGLLPAGDDSLRLDGREDRVVARA